MEIAGNYYNCSHMCCAPTCQNSHQLYFRPTCLGLSCSTILFATYCFQKGVFWLLW
jgi:hypothetical protein